MTDEELDQIIKKNTSEWTTDERAKVSEAAREVRQARKDALEPFAKIAERYMIDAVDRGRTDDEEHDHGPKVTVGMLRSAYRAFNRRT